MKTAVISFLVIFIFIPVLLRSQNEGVKNVAASQAKSNPPMYSKTTQPMAMVQEAGTKGGTSTETGYINYGGMYLEPGWVNGFVVLRDQTLLENVQLRYDIYHQQMQFVRNDDTLAFRDPEELLLLSLDGKRFMHAQYQNDHIIGSGYFEILSDGDCQLLLRRSIKYHMSPESKPRLDEDVYVAENGYYILKDGEIAKPVRACKKSVLCAFEDKKDQIKDYLEQNKLKMKTCDDLIRVVDYYNSLE